MFHVSRTKLGMFWLSWPKSGMFRFVLDLKLLLNAEFQSQNCTCSTFEQLEIYVEILAPGSHYGDISI